MKMRLSTEGINWHRGQEAEVFVCPRGASLTSVCDRSVCDGRSCRPGWNRCVDGDSLGKKLYRCASQVRFRQ